ncbi:LysR substrate-binding domain-containing protein [Salinicola rhizosphaerae]|uniref:LysR family transcriptional regulator n=1 Tax=Salinicola rhizosphaerae TaxID=1443141 RepID=A0ABQ3E3T1_9GAMM|nr:LysR substrate-binding domain-containing protein [Salinicola rhizosphaerae]GHB24833.1 LysR family transcriptional regulator [Salinicola rhizosphaerae]
MSRWEGIEAFVAVVRLGTFSRAAASLKVSNSHVSRLVSQLEQTLGTPLLYRTTRQIRLTDSGALYFEHCRTLLDGFEEAESALNALQSQPRGRLALSCATTFGERYIAPLVNDFHRLYPQLEVRLHFTNRTVELIDEGFDIAIRMGVLRDSSLLARRLCSRRENIVGSPDYFQRHAAPHSLSELARHNCLIGSRDSWLFNVDGKQREVQVSGNWRGNSGPALLDAARKGIGLAQLPDYYVENAMERGELIPVLTRYQFTDTAVWAVYPRHRQLSPKIRLLVDFLVEHLPASIAGWSTPARHGVND